MKRKGTMADYFKVGKKGKATSEEKGKEDEPSVDADLTKSTEKKKKTLFSGGAQGADSLFSQLADKAGHDCQNFSFEGHHANTTIGLKVLKKEQLDEAIPFLREACRDLGRHPNLGRSANLLKRNYHQIKHTEAVFAAGFLEKNRKKDSCVGVDGGTAWACQMFAKNAFKTGSRGPIPLFFYDQNCFTWKQCHLDQDSGEMSIKWEYLACPPPFPDKYTGIGSRVLSWQGERAIRALYEEKTPVIKK